MRPQRSIPLALGALAAALLACGAEPPPPSKPRPLRSMVVGDAEGLERRRFPGRAQATQELNLAFEVAGRMIERPVMVGSEVQQGDVLAVLDPRDFQNALDRSVAERDRSKAFYERVAQAARTGAVSQQEVTDAEARMRRAEATLRINQKALDDSVLVAPFAGTYRPQGLLSDFDGELIGGNWKLQITDDGLDDEGALLAWYVELTVGDIATQTPQPLRHGRHGGNGSDRADGGHRGRGLWAAGDQRRQAEHGRNPPELRGPHLSRPPCCVHASSDPRCHEKNPLTRRL